MERPRDSLHGIEPGVYCRVGVLSASVKCLICAAEGTDARVLIFKSREPLYGISELNTGRWSMKGCQQLFVRETRCV